MCTNIEFLLDVKLSLRIAHIDSCFFCQSSTAGWNHLKHLEFLLGDLQRVKVLMETRATLAGFVKPTLDTKDATEAVRRSRR